MNLGTIFDNLNVVLNKHRSGNSYSPKEFNVLIKVEQLNFFNHQVKKMQRLSATDSEFKEMMLSSKILRLLITSTNITPTVGVYSMSSLTRFSNWLSCITTAAYHGSIKSVELISHNELEERQTDLLKPNIYYNPVCVLTGTNAKFYPTDIGQMEFTYLQIPTEPIFDYYIDANRNLVFLAEGTTRTLTTGQVGSAGQTSGTVTSLTNELDFPTEYYPEFFEYLLSRLGVRSENGLVYQSAELEKSKQ